MHRLKEQVIKNCSGKRNFFSLGGPVRSIFLVCILSLLFSCTSNTRYLDTTKVEGDHSKHPVKPMLDEYAHYLESKEVLPMGSGITEGADGSILSIYLVGVTQQQLNVREARKLLVQSVVELLERVNADQNLRPLLKHHPFSSSKVHLSLLMADDKGRQVKEGAYVTKLSLRDGLVRYYAYDAKSRPKVEKYEPNKLKNKFYKEEGYEGKNSENLVVLEQELFSESLDLYTLYDKTAASIESNRKLYFLDADKSGLSSVDGDEVLEKVQVLEGVEQQNFEVQADEL